MQAHPLCLWERDGERKREQEEERERESLSHVLPWTMVCNPAFHDEKVREVRREVPLKCLVEGNGSATSHAVKGFSSSTTMYTAAAAAAAAVAATLRSGQGLASGHGGEENTSGTGDDLCSAESFMKLMNT
jgi:hypothetical protein